MFLALAREDATPLARALETLPPIPEDCQWANFVRNHDELTLDKLSEDERQEVFAAFGPEKDLQLYGRGLRRRLPTMLDGDERRIRLAYSLAFSLPGTPVLFYGEEIGMAENLGDRGPLQRAVARCSGRRSRRPASPPPAKPCRPLVEEGPFSYREVNATSQRRDPDSLLNWMERLIRRRRECPELGWGTWALLDTGDDAVFAHRCDWEDSTVVAVHNLAGREASAHLVLGGEGELVDLFEDEDHDLDAGEITLELDPYGYRWFRLRRPGARAAALAGQLLDGGEVEVAVVGAEALRDQRRGGAAEPRGVAAVAAEAEPAQEAGGEGVAAAGGVHDLHLEGRDPLCAVLVHEQHAVGAAGGGHAAHAAVEQRAAAGLERRPRR